LTHNNLTANARLIAAEHPLRTDDWVLGSLPLFHINGLVLTLLTPHCPQQNGMVERVIRTLKEQCTHRQRFESIQYASRAISGWIVFYKHQRPHQALKMKTPTQAF